jgi:hypothetical protein
MPDCYHTTSTRALRAVRARALTDGTASETVEARIPVDTTAPAGTRLYLPAMSYGCGVVFAEEPGRQPLRPCVSPIGLPSVFHSSS